MEPIKRTFLVEFKGAENPNTILSFVAKATNAQSVANYIRRQGEDVEILSVYVKVENWK